MSRTHSSSVKIALSAALSLVSIATVWSLLMAAPAAPTAPATTESLGGVDRYVAHVSTDKPIYRAGEDVYVRAVVLNALTRQPYPAAQVVRAVIELKGPKGDVIASGAAQGKDSVIGLRWRVPDGQAGGKYKVHVSFPGLGFPPAERDFEIRAYRAPRLKSQIVFLRDGYGPSDEVVATLHTERAEGGTPEGARVTVLARVDSMEIYRGATTVNAEGDCEGRFSLPKTIARGEGTLAFVIEDGGVVETATKTIPILLQTVDVKLYPEGGELVAGLATRVYVAALTPAKKPADIAGVIVDEDGRELAPFRTEHEGRGRVAFTPEAGHRYEMRVTEPAGIDTTYALPDVKAEGAVIRAQDDVAVAGASVRLMVGTTDGGAYTVTLKRREVEVARATLRLGSGCLVPVILEPDSLGEGVLVATLWDGEGRPVAERLVFREPTHRVHVEIVVDKDRPIPGDSVDLAIRTTDEDGQPVSSVVGLTVTDDSVLEMIEKREQAPRLPVMVFLEDEVRDLADAQVYLDPENADAPRDVDLLLGTQGWRRFAFLHPTDFLAHNGDAARRVLGLRIVTRAEVLGFSGVGRGGGGFGVDKFRKARPMGRAEVEGGVDDVPLAAAQEGAPVEEEPEASQVPAPPADLRQDMAAAIDAAKEMEKKKILARRVPNLRSDVRGPSEVVIVREYAHDVRSDREPGERRDFTETLYWHAGVRTDATTGEARVSFALNDSVTAFRVFADAFDDRGALGSATTTIESVQPFYVEPKLPLEVTAGDEIRLPVSVVSGIAERLIGVKLAVSAAKGLKVTQGGAFDLAPEARVRRIVSLKVRDHRGAVDVVVDAKAGAYGDRVTRPLSIVPAGFPVELAEGGMLGENGSAKHRFTIPKELVANSVSTKIVVYSTPLANLTQALERLLREPFGCFEQTSSTTYPLVMAQQYFLAHRGVDPKLVERAKRILAKGYKRLTGFECSSHGYEWFGQDPAHETLSAYGLMEFTDMAKVREVDSGMLDRTRAWVMSARDGDGGFTRKRRALHTWIEDKDCSDGYILWTLLESGGAPDSLAKEIDAFTARAAKSENSYVIALGANVLALAGRDATELLERLRERQTKDGWVDGGTATIVGSGGESLKIETTSLATLAWLRDDAFAGDVEKAMRFLSESCKAGRYGSTQATVLTLRAIVAYDAKRAHPKKAGSVRVYVNNQPVGDPIQFDANTKSAIMLPDVAELMGSGEQTIELRMEDGAEMPYSVTVNYHTTRPPSSPECEVGLEVELIGERLTEGEVTEIHVSVSNRSSESIPTPIAIIGLPGGLEPRHDQLEELVKSKKIAAYEVLGREVVLYWRSLAGGETRELPLSLIAAIPGSYTGPASRAYLYYTDELKTWTRPLHATIQAK